MARRGVQTSAGGRHFLATLYDMLTVPDSGRPVDVAFVFAGRMDRKQYALELLRSGVVERLVLSVGRFEVSKMSALALPRTDELIALRSVTPPQERHFFVNVDASGIRIDKVRLPRWNTYGEALGLRRYVAGDNAGAIMVVSTAIHLRRISYTLARVFQDTAIEFRYCSVPEDGALRKDAWWTCAGSRRYVMSELIKLVSYRLILAMPQWLRRRVMRARE